MKGSNLVRALNMFNSHGNLNEYLDICTLRKSCPNSILYSNDKSFYFNRCYKILSTKNGNIYRGFPVGTELDDEKFDIDSGEFGVSKRNKIEIKCGVHHTGIPLNAFGVTPKGDYITYSTNFRVESDRNSSKTGFETGIKAIDLFTPIKKGMSIIVAGEDIQFKDALLRKICKKFCATDASNICVNTGIYEDDPDIHLKALLDDNRKTDSQNVFFYARMRDFPARKLQLMNTACKTLSFWDKMRQTRSVLHVVNSVNDFINASNEIKFQSNQRLRNFNPNHFSYKELSEDITMKQSFPDFFTMLNIPHISTLEKTVYLWNMNYPMSKLLNLMHPLPILFKVYDAVITLGYTDENLPHYTTQPVCVDILRSSSRKFEKNTNSRDSNHYNLVKEIRKLLIFNEKKLLMPFLPVRNSVEHAKYIKCALLKTYLTTQNDSFVPLKTVISDCKEILNGKLNHVSIKKLVNIGSLKDIADNNN